MAVVAAGAPGGIKVVDLTNPAAPSIIGTYDTPGSAYAVALNSTGTLAYVADGSQGLKILSLSNPRSPTLAGSLSTYGSWTDVAVQGGTACLVNQLAGTFDVVDVSIPSAPKRLGGADVTIGTGVRIAIDDTAPATVAVLSSDNDQGDFLEVFDISIPAQPVSEGYTLIDAVKSTATI